MSKNFYHKKFEYYSRWFFSLSKTERKTDIGIWVFQRAEIFAGFLNKSNE